MIEFTIDKLKGEPWTSIEKLEVETAYISPMQLSSKDFLHWMDVKQVSLKELESLGAAYYDLALFSKKFKADNLQVVMASPTLPPFYTTNKPDVMLYVFKGIASIIIVVRIVGIHCKAGVVIRDADDIAYHFFEDYNPYIEVELERKNGLRQNS